MQKDVFIQRAESATDDLNAEPRVTVKMTGIMSHCTGHSKHVEQWDILSKMRGLDHEYKLSTFLA